MPVQKVSRYVEEIPVDRYNVDYDYMAVKRSDVIKAPAAESQRAYSTGYGYGSRAPVA